MISRTKGIFLTNLWKSKNIHSLEYLKYLYVTLNKNETITEQNRDLLVEIFRLIAEILIWGDQNDSSIMDFFLEKNILSSFLKFMNQINGKMIYKQLLQTLSIIFENISDKSSIYYLLSNNHINAIICHKFDFDDEEVMAYYISFLKALSMKLNKHTVHFFYNEHTDDFALFTEAIKFFNHSESMVRTAVRNITLNVFRVIDKAILRYIRDKTAEPYFHNLMWFIGNRILNFDILLKYESKNPHCLSRLQGIVDEHLDHLHYINDILCLNVEPLNDVLMNSLLNKLYTPLYIYSLFKHHPSSVYPTSNDAQKPYLSYAISMFLLAQIFITIKHHDFTDLLATIIITGNFDRCPTFNSSLGRNIKEIKFEAPLLNLAQALDNIKGNPRPRSREYQSKTIDDPINESVNHTLKLTVTNTNELTGNSAPVTPRHRYNSESLPNNRSHNESAKCTDLGSKSDMEPNTVIMPNLQNGQFMTTVCRFLELEHDGYQNDHDTLLTMCLLFAICQNQGVNETILNSCGLTSKSLIKSEYNIHLMDKLINVLNISVKYGSTIRLVTLELASILIETLVCSHNKCWISDEHFAYILTAYEESKLLLRNYYKSEDVFVDMFEDEYMDLKKRPMNVEFLLMDAGILLPNPSSNTLDFPIKYPSKDVQRARYSIRVFLLLRQLCDKLKVDDDGLSDVSGDNSIDTYPFNLNVISVSDKLDLTSRDLIPCTVEYNSKSEQRFLIVDEQQFILIEPDSSRVGWGIVTFVGFIQHLRVTGSRDDSKSFLITLYGYSGPTSSKNQGYGAVKLHSPIFNAKFIFEDHTKRAVAQNRLEKGREMVHQLKLQQIALMLDFPTNVALGIKSEPSNNSKEYRSGYFGPKENVVENNNQKIISETDSASELHIDKMYFH